MNEPSAGTVELGRCLVTGCSGYLGGSLARELLRRGQAVRGFDRAPPEHALPDFVRGDVRDFEAVRKACEGVDTVFHTVALLDFHRFASRPRRERARAINVTGVENVVRACRAEGVVRLVHTSTNNVTFGDPVIDGDETWPYASDVRDLYTQTKIEGEKIALAANGEGLATCAIRPGGIYGPGERLIFPRFVEQCARGRFRAIVGDGSALSDNTFIDNLVDGHIEAARHLAPGSPVCGQAYFVTDGAPINYFEFFRPYAAAFGVPFPTWRIPAGPVYAIAWLCELLRLPAPAGMTHLEVRKLAGSHYSRIDKARRDFGWVPKVSPEEAVRRCLPYVRKLREELELVDRPHWAWWLAIPFGMALLAVLAFDAGAHAWWAAHVTSWTPRWLLQPIFVWAALLHVYKGMKAVRLAERAGLHASSMGWGWQTFLLGFASLGLLEKRIERLRGRESGPGGA